MEAWLHVDNTSDFTIHNIPFGIGSTGEDSTKFVVTAIGNYVINLAVLEEENLFDRLLTERVFNQDTVNAFISQGKDVWSKVRKQIQFLLSNTQSPLKNDEQLQQRAIFNRQEITMHQPLKINDYTDFYASKHHAVNVGTIFRGPDNALMPNWTHLPIAYHGRASSIIASGTPVKRPSSQIKLPNENLPIFSPTRQFDYELEMGIVIGNHNRLGEPVSVNEAKDYLFGMVLLNDWSARDIQAFEYQPLGPFLAKNFSTSISPWIITFEALEPFKTPGIEREHEVLPYLQEGVFETYDIQLDILLKTEKLDRPEMIASSNYKYLYWSAEQMVAHHTVNGCALQVGDLFGTGTISGPSKSEYGSFLELTWRGKEPIQLSSGEQRVWLEDGDELIMKGFCEKDGIRIGFGEVTGVIEPAHTFNFNKKTIDV